MASFEPGRLTQRVTLDTPGAANPGGDGGYVDWSPLAARVPASVAPASARSLERLVAAGSEAVATHVVTVRYLSGVTTKTRVTFHDGSTDRLLYVAGVFDEGEQHRVLQLVCNEAAS